jgi:cyclopropane-fatty-acyl-phospholipid synthase
MSLRDLTARAARRAIFRSIDRLADGGLEVACADGTHRFGDPADPCRARIVVHDDRAFARLLFGGDIGFGEAYMDGDWSSPDLVALVRLALRNARLWEEEHRALSAASRWLDFLRHRRRPNTLGGSRANIAYHYDRGNAFYRLFLDRTMAYSCGVYRSPADSLEAAQEHKYDLICRKLRLGPADHVLEIGGGWGGFALHAASRYGCRVTTTTISREQHDHAAALFAGASLAPGQVTLLSDDYRRLAGRFDRIVSIEMFEAVGYRNYDAFFGACDRLLAPHGTLLLQTITNVEQRMRGYLRSSDWIRKYIFPGGELASVAGILQSLARATGMSLYHAEEIGTHYARTLHAWRERFHGALDEVRAMGFDDRFVRMWDFYLATCEALFLERQIGDVQLLLTKNYNRQALMDEPWEGAEMDARPAAPGLAATG